MVGELGIFGTLVSNLNAMGFYGFVLPWLLVFALVYGLIKKAGIINDKANGLISLAVAFFVTAYSGIGTFFIALSGLGGMLLGALLIVVLFFAMLGFDVSKTVEAFKGWTGILFLAVIGVIVFFTVGGGSISGITLSSEISAAVFMVIVIALAVAFVGGEGK